MIAPGEAVASGSMKSTTVVGFSMIPEHRADDRPDPEKVSRVLIPMAAGCFMEPRIGR